MKEGVCYGESKQENILSIHNYAAYASCFRISSCICGA